MNEIKLGNLSMPLNAVTRSFAILAKRGAGKTYTAAVLAEEFHKNNIPFVVIDPIDVWWGLRLKANGKDTGFPIVIFGIHNADIKLDKDMGRRIAQEIVKKNISCVISTFGMPKNQQRHLIAEFADELININNTPRHVFIEEAHEFLPQRVFGGLGVVFNSVSNLVVMGRNRGIGVTLINQRAATLNKDVLTQVDTLIALRNIGPQDRKALSEWVEYHTAEGDFEKFMDSLPSLPTGQAWVWSPEFLNIFQLIKIRPRETFHPDREKLDSKFVMPSIQHIDIEEFIKNFPKSVDKVTKIKKEETIEKNQEITNLSSELMQKLKNEYESKLIQKDIEIQKRDKLLNQLRIILDVQNIQSNAIINSKSESLIESLPDYHKDIMKAIMYHPNIPFTRAELALKSGKSYTSSAYLAAIRKLIQINLLIESNNQLMYKG